MIYHDVHLVKSALVSGENLVFLMTYTKRAECHPPLGSSDISYRVWHRHEIGNGHYQWLDYAELSKAPAGVMATLPSPTVIPMPPLSGGRYGFQIQARYQCAGSSGEQVINSPIVPFTIIG
jgi:hypothetical protein